MTTLAIHSETRALIKPEPRVEVVGGPIRIRPADLERGGDFMFIDDLQKKHGRMVGFMARDWFDKNHVLIAETGIKAPRHQGIEGAEGNPDLMPGCLDASMPPARLGYIVFKDKYMKREELGIIHQLNVVPHKQRGLVGASLVKAAFEHCPYGVRLFCCWVAQDLEANHFWESIGFVPIAFRTGARGKANGGKRPEDRLQIFWQRRIREGDDGPPTPGGTPFWYPTETSGGGVKENRIVLPILPNVHWSDVMPTVLPGGPGQGLGVSDQGLEAKALEGDAPKQRKPRGGAAKRVVAPVKHKASASGGLWFAPPQTQVKPPHEKPKREKRPRQKNDPKHIATARELRDRYLEEMNAGLILPRGGNGGGKYDVSRQLEGAVTELKPLPLLSAA